MHYMTVILYIVGDNYSYYTTSRVMTHPSIRLLAAYENLRPQSVKIVRTTLQKVQIQLQCIWMAKQLGYSYVTKFNVWIQTLPTNCSLFSLNNNILYLSHDAICNNDVPWCMVQLYRFAHSSLDLSSSFITMNPQDCIILHGKQISNIYSYESKTYILVGLLTPFLTSYNHYSQSETGSKVRESNIHTL